MWLWCCDGEKPQMTIKKIGRMMINLIPTSLNSKAKVLFWVSVLIVLISGAFVQKEKVSGRAV